MDFNQSSKYSLEALSAFGYFGERSYGLYKSPPGFSKTFRRSIGNWTAIKAQSIPSRLLSAFGYLERVLRSLQVPTWSACACCYSKAVWLMRGPSRIGSDPPGHRSKLHVFTSRLQVPLDTWKGSYGPYRSPPALLLLKNGLVDERSIGNRIRPTWSSNQSSKYSIEALSAFGYFGGGFGPYRFPPG